MSPETSQGCPYENITITSFGTNLRSNGKSYTNQAGIKVATAVKCQVPRKVAIRLQLSAVISHLKNQFKALGLSLKIPLKMSILIQEELIFS